MYLVMKVTMWDGVKIEAQYGKIKTTTNIVPLADGSIGFSSIFDDYQKALDYAKNPALVMVVLEANK